jgi:hypothetical protein
MNPLFTVNACGCLKVRHALDLMVALPHLVMLAKSVVPSLWSANHSRCGNEDNWVYLDGHLAGLDLLVPIVRCVGNFHYLPLLLIWLGLT